MTDAAAVDAVPEAAADAADPQIAANRDAEAERLRKQARVIAIALTVAIVAAFAVGIGIITSTEPFVQLTGVALVGFAGSGVGALTSLLARYAAGVELDSGERVPAAAEGEVFHRRIAFCFVMRPVLGVLVAPLLVGGIMLFMSKHEELKGSLEAMMLISFIGGLYAKSALETAKNAFKLVFRA